MGGGGHGGGEELVKKVVDKVDDDDCQEQEKEILAGLVQGLRIVRSDGDYLGTFKYDELYEQHIELEQDREIKGKEYSY